MHRREAAITSEIFDDYYYYSVCWNLNALECLDATSMNEDSSSEI